MIPVTHVDVMLILLTFGYAALVFYGLAVGSRMEKVSAAYKNVVVKHNALVKQVGELVASHNWLLERVETVVGAHNASVEHAKNIAERLRFVEEAWRSEWQSGESWKQGVDPADLEDWQ